MIDSSQADTRAEPIPAEMEGLARDPDVLTVIHRGRFCLGHDPLGGDGLVPGCTVVICTHRRARSLKRFLDSLAAHDTRPEATVIVDASPDRETERVVAEDNQIASREGCLLYLHVQGKWKGLTRQRNLGSRCVKTDLLVFFDDDVVLLPGCLSEMEKVHRNLGGEVAGVGAVTHNEGLEPSRRPLWRLRRALGIVTSLAPGRYFRSGMSTPWGALSSDRGLVEGDWLPGCGMMWKTSAVAELRFNDEFEGYSLGEDVDFSLRARQRGKLLMAPTARLKHIQDSREGGDNFRMGYDTIFNRYQIHRRGLPDRSWRDVAAFAYAWSLDTLILLRHLVSPRKARSIWDDLRGRVSAARDLIRRNKRSSATRR